MANTPKSKNRKMRERAAAINEDVRDIALREACRRNMADNVDFVVQEENKKLNRFAVELADKMGITIWDLCAQYVPHYHIGKVNVGPERTTWEQAISIEPAPLPADDYTDYECKYNRLKEQLRQILND